jgi:gephyrin
MMIHLYIQIVNKMFNLLPYFFSLMLVGVLTISDRASNGKEGYVDTSGPYLVDQLKACEYKICPDEVLAIQEIIKNWTKKKLNLIITTGGTGLSHRDVTVSAIKPLLDKEAYGITNAIMTKSLEITPFAMLSSPICGIFDKTLIITFPGSLKAVKENLEIVKPILSHAVNLVLDPSDSSHPQSLQKNTCRCTRDIAENVSGNSDQMLTIESALRIIDSVILKMEEITLDVRDSINKLWNHTVAEDIYSEYSIPEFRASIVDGYAVLASDPPGTFTVVDYISAGKQEKQTSLLRKGEAVYITTGSPLPKNAEGVVMVEDTEKLGQDNKILIKVKSYLNQNIRDIGSDVQKGELVMKKGTVLNRRNGQIGLIKACVDKIKVQKKPIVAVLSTGSEITDGVAREIGQVVDTNRPALILALEDLGFETIDCGIVGDNYKELRAALEKALEKADVVVSTGGVSMGEFDFVKEVLVKEFNAVIHFSKLKMKPGKPTTFASVGRKVFFGLPGNPVSAMVSFYVFVVKALNKMKGGGKEKWIRSKIEKENYNVLDERAEFRRVKVYLNNGNIAVNWNSQGMQRSSRLNSMNGANGLAYFPALNDEESDVGKSFMGGFVNILMIDEINII